MKKFREKILKKGLILLEKHAIMWNCMKLCEQEV